MTMNMRLRHLMTAFLAATFIFYPYGNAKEDDCACTAKGIRLHGRVKVVDAFPDLKVKIVEAFPDLKVKIVEHFPDDCGEWQMVDSFPDFTIKFVDAFPDIKIQYVSSFPGETSTR